MRDIDKKAATTRDSSRLAGCDSHLKEVLVIIAFPIENDNINRFTDNGMEVQQ